MLYPHGTAHQQGSSVYDILARGQTSRSIELRRRKDGSTFWNPGDGRAGHPQEPHKGSGWIVEDHTEETRAAAELQRLLARQQAPGPTLAAGVTSPPRART